MTEPEPTSKTTCFQTPMILTTQLYFLSSKNPFSSILWSQLAYLTYNFNVPLNTATFATPVNSLAFYTEQPSPWPRKMEKAMKQKTSIQNNTEHAHTHIPEQHYNQPWLTYYFCPFSSESLKSYISIFSGTLSDTHNYVTEGKYVRTL